MDHSGPDCANKTAEGYLRPYAEVCARRRAVSCTSRRSASSCTGIDDTACIGIETPSSDTPALWLRRKKRGKRGDAGEDAWRDPFNARRIAGTRPSTWRAVDDGTCGPGVNAGDSRINQQDRPLAQRPERLAGPADRAYTRYLQTKECIRCRGVTSCRLATSNECIGSYDLGISLEVFADADYASRATDRRSVSGGAIMCAGACVCWFSRTQKCVTFSTSEAEYVALGDAVKELLFLRQVWRFMIPDKGMPCFPVFEDNQDALQLSKNPVSNSNSKHIDVRHHFLRELVRQGDIIVNNVSSEC